MTRHYRELTLDQIKQMIYDLNDGLNMESARITTMAAILTTCRKLCDVAQELHGVDLIDWARDVLDEFTGSNPLELTSGNTKKLPPGEGLN